MGFVGRAEKKEVSEYVVFSQYSDKMVLGVGIGFVMLIIFGLLVIWILNDESKRGR